MLVFTPLFSTGATTTVSLHTDASSYPGQAGTHVAITGTVTPAPGGTAYYAVSLEINSSQGLLAVYSTQVDDSTGSFSYTLTTGYSSNGWINGTYTITAVYQPSVSGPTYTSSTTFQYGGSSTTTSTSSSGQSTTTVTTTVTSTATSVSTTTQLSMVTVPTTVTSSTTITSTSTVTNSTWEYVGIAGIAAAVVLAGIAVFMMRRR